MKQKTERGCGRSCSQSTINNVINGNLPIYEHITKSYDIKKYATLRCIANISHSCSDKERRSKTNREAGTQTWLKLQDSKHILR